MPDNIRESRYYTVFDELASYFWTLSLGLSLTALAIGLLRNNEASAISNEHFSKGKETQEVVAAPRNIDPANDGKLVYICGNAKTEQALSDMNGLIKVRALRLKRDNRFYQWTESKIVRQRPGLLCEVQDTNYGYDKHYESEKIDSTKFKYQQDHINAKLSESFTHDQVATVHMGNYVLSKGFAEELDMLPFKFSGLKLPKQSARRWNGKPYVLADDSLIVCNDYNKPQIGDELITLSYAPEGIYSVVGRQQGSELEPIKLDDGNVVNTIRTGTVPSSAILKGDQLHAIEILWGIRVAGILLIWVGLYFLFVPLQGFLQAMPGFQFLNACDPLEFAISFGFSLGLLVIASSWTAQHPHISYLLYAAGFVSAVLMYLFKTNKAAQEKRLEKNVLPIASN